MFLDRLSPASFLRTVLWCDAISSALMGLALVAGAALLALPLGLPTTLLQGAGLGLLPFAAFVAWQASRSAPRTGVWLVIAVNLVWVVESLALLTSDRVAPTALGIGFVMLQAAAVATLAGFEIIALRRCRSAAPAA